MLYISRREGPWQVAVMDTDDGVEEIMLNDELCATADAWSLQIEGLRRSGFRLERIIPYQPIGTMTKQQVKLLTLFNICLTMDNGLLTGIKCDEMRLPKSMQLRLSDFSLRIGDCILACNLFKGPVPGYKLTLVFDDKLELHSDVLSFGERSFFGRVFLDDFVRFDLTEMSESKALLIYYWIAHLDRIGHANANTLIVDLNKRKHGMIRDADRKVLEEIEQEERDNAYNGWW